MTKDTASKMQLEHEANTPAMFEVIGKACMKPGGLEKLIEHAKTFPGTLPLPDEAECVQMAVEALFDAQDVAAALGNALSKEVGPNHPLLKRAEKRFLRVAGVMAMLACRKETLAARIDSADTSKVN